MLTTLKRAALIVLMRLPRGVRARILLLAGPAYSVGALAFVVDDGALLLVRPVYRPGWGAPGGLLNRKELPSTAVVRELREELGIAITAAEPGIADVRPERRSVTVWLRAELADPGERARVRVQTFELVEAAWFPLDALPPDIHEETLAGVHALDLVRRT